MSTEPVVPLLDELAKYIEKPCRNADTQGSLELETNVQELKTSEALQEDKEANDLEQVKHKIYSHCKGSGLDEVCQYGSVKRHVRYAVFSSSVIGEHCLNYAVNLPLAALAWHRIGYDSIVMVVGDAFSCQNRTKTQYIMEKLHTLCS
jgi:hypothetical protein